MSEIYEFSLEDGELLLTNNSYLPEQRFNLGFDHIEEFPLVPYLHNYWRGKKFSPQDLDSENPRHLLPSPLEETLANILEIKNKIARVEIDHDHLNELMMRMNITDFYGRSTDNGKHRVHYSWSIDEEKKLFLTQEEVSSIGLFDTTPLLTSYHCLMTSLDQDSQYKRNYLEILRRLREDE
ncbi:hypothetical protein CMI42_01385 [Candidatus Pacearchaeota archaeon]|nr:hypothetical protein [Candidatus Pacearchaeota archaeon]|tara:strand:- start:522 stop:1064 length:543 start_codon:yes stop_codon:yes gene_type:complete